MNNLDFLVPYIVGTIFLCLIIGILIMAREVDKARKNDKSRKQEVRK